MRLATFLAAVSALGSAAFLGGAGASRRLRATYPPPGELVDVGGYRLHLIVQGVGTPTVVLDGGIGALALSWAAIQSELAVLTRIVAYDRAGMGWSEPSPQPRTNLVMADELHTLLHEAGVPPPYLLVGHSLGGLTMRVFAHRFPMEVAGIVLIDAVHEDQYLPPVLQRSLTQMIRVVPRMLGLFQLLVRTGIPALRPALLPLAVPSRLPAASAAAYRGLYARDPRSYATTAAEIKAIPHSHAELRDMQPRLPAHVPVVVIRHGQRQAQMTPAATDAMEQTNERLQAALAASVPQGTLIVAERSGHDIPNDQPDVVIAAIGDVLATLRSQTPSGSTPQESAPVAEASVMHAGRPEHADQRHHPAYHPCGVMRPHRPNQYAGAIDSQHQQRGETQLWH